MSEDPFARGVRLFDAGAYFEAHEAWEDLWRASTDEAERRTLQGLIQIAAAFHKLRVMRSPESAARLLERGLTKIEARAHGADSGSFHGVDLVAFARDLRANAFHGPAPMLRRRAREA